MNTKYKITDVFFHTIEYSQIKTIPDGQVNCEATYSLSLKEIADAAGFDLKEDQIHVTCLKEDFLGKPAGSLVVRRIALIQPGQSEEIVILTISPEK